MEVRIPINRTHIKQLIKACWAALMGHHVTLKFDTEDVALNGQEGGVLMTQEDITKIEMRLAERAALLEFMQDKLTELGEDAPEARALRAALSVVGKPRVLH